ncbi:glycine betaine ABC transporter substrate-binding protein [Gordonia sp. HY285]|uniref:glycine betaine ABC transporter substrate-binding protein n=1 Tax=Gordonia liuliyuniae TaxID=2911517 RepID=UPI001F2A0FCD|nr:glycine betaine ABC transporter substrate-binding protein [Gordonia liuliyuniae]MCF8611595.1 glycine betaine ABC transporter substrate-binding protein [Gordonia liuliyuniae]
MSRLLRRGGPATVVPVVLVAVLLAVALAGCGLISSSGTLRSAHLPDGDKPLDGAAITVTSKAFTEQVVLGKIAATYLAAAGADIKDMTGAPGAASSRQAQLRGETDLQWEYTGTGWVVYHERTDPISDPTELWNKVRDIEAAENDLIWLPPSSLNNTYAFAASQETANRLGVTTLSDVAALPVDQRTFCIDDEFFSRSDGFLPMLEAYGIPFDTADGVPQSNVTRMDSGVIYTATAKGSPCNFGMVFSTDGRIPNLDLKVLDDDRKYFLPYSGSVVVRKPVLDENPQIAELMETVSSKLNDDVMRDLNGRVDIEGEDPADVAFDWLVSEKLIVPN